MDPFQTYQTRSIGPGIGEWQDVTQSEALDWLRCHGIVNTERYLETLQPGEIIRSVFSNLRRTPDHEEAF